MVGVGMVRRGEAERGSRRLVGETEVEAETELGQGDTGRGGA